MSAAWKVVELADTAIRQIVKPKPPSEAERRQAAYGAIAVERDRMTYADYARQKAIDEGFGLDGPFKEPLR